MQDLFTLPIGRSNYGVNMKLDPYLQHFYGP